MKTARIILTGFLLTTGLAGWLAVFSTPSSRVRIEPDVADIPGHANATMACDPYFDHVNEITKILIPAIEQK
ncbi:MAG TPA: hypothetical protein VGO57_14200 [Verrucomicrobiae bacterium]|jgi:hypothetical protein